MTDAQRKRLFERARRAVLAGKTKLQRDTAREILRLLNVARDRVREVLAGQPSDYQQWRLPQIEADIARRLREFERAAGNVASGSVSQAWDSGVALVDAPLRAAGLATAQTGIASTQVEALSVFMADRIKGLSARALDRINTELAMTVLGVQPPGDTIAKVQRVLGDQSRQRAITIVRTETGRAFSAANQARLESAKETLPQLKKMWRRSGKVHSRAEHDAIDGQVREVNEPFVLHDSRTGARIELMYPRDPAGPPGQTINCGCESLPYMEEFSAARQAVPFSEREMPAAELARNPAKAAAAARARR